MTSPSADFHRWSNRRFQPDVFRSGTVSASGPDVLKLDGLTFAFYQAGRVSEWIFADALGPVGVIRRSIGDEAELVETARPERLREVRRAITMLEFITNDLRSIIEVLTWWEPDASRNGRLEVTTSQRYLVIECDSTGFVLKRKCQGVTTAGDAFESSLEVRNVQGPIMSRNTSAGRLWFGPNDDDRSSWRMST